MPGMGGVLRNKPKETEPETIMVGDVGLKEAPRQKGRFTGYRERGTETVVVDMTMARNGYNLKVSFLGGGEWVQTLKGNELKKALDRWGFKGDYLGKVLHEADLRGAALDKTLKGVDIIRVVAGNEGGADVQVIKGNEVVQTLRGAIVKNHIDISEGWIGVPRGTAGTSVEFNRLWDDARMAHIEYLRTRGKDLPDRITPFMGQGHVLG
jgi:hypothetical protein